LPLAKFVMHQAASNYIKCQLFIILPIVLVDRTCLGTLGTWVQDSYQ